MKFAKKNSLKIAIHGLLIWALFLACTHTQARTLKEIRDDVNAALDVVSQEFETESPSISTISEQITNLKTLQTELDEADPKSFEAEVNAATSIGNVNPYTDLKGKLKNKIEETISHKEGVTQAEEKLLKPLNTEFNKLSSNPCKNLRALTALKEKLKSNQAKFSAKAKEVKQLIKAIDSVMQKCSKFTFDVVLHAIGIGSSPEPTPTPKPKKKERITGPGDFGPIDELPILTDETPTAPSALKKTKAVQQFEEGKFTYTFRKTTKDEFTDIKFAVEGFKCEVKKPTHKDVNNNTVPRRTPKGKLSLKFNLTGKGVNGIGKNIKQGVENKRIITYKFCRSAK